MATHSSIRAWRIPWTEEPDGLQSIESERVRQAWSDSAGTQGCSQIKCDSVYKGEINSSYVLSNFLYILLCFYFCLPVLLCYSACKIFPTRKLRILTTGSPVKSLLCAFLTYESSYFLLLESGRVGINKWICNWKLLLTFQNSELCYLLQEVFLNHLHSPCLSLI